MAVRVGLIGAGRMAHSLARHLVQDVGRVELVAIADVIRDRAAELAGRYGVSGVHEGYESLLAAPDVQAVVIATPTSTHPEVVEAAAAAGKHIFCEKPLALDVEGCDRAIAAAEGAGVKLQVGFMRRFDPAYQAAFGVIASGEIGRPVMFKASSRDPQRTSLEFARRESSGGLIMDMAVHDIDLARWLMGSEIARVHAEGECLAFPELRQVNDIDNAVINLRFSSGALGNIDVSRNAVYGKDIRTEVLGTEGTVVVGDQGTVVVRKKGAQREATSAPATGDRFAGAIVAELREFVDCILEDRPPRLLPSEARRATAVAVAATRSLDEGRAVSV